MSGTCRSHPKGRYDHVGVDLEHLACRNLGVRQIDRGSRANFGQGGNLVHRLGSSCLLGGKSNPGSRWCKSSGFTPRPPAGHGHQARAQSGVSKVDSLQSFLGCAVPPLASGWCRFASSLYRVFTASSVSARRDRVSPTAHAARGACRAALEADRASLVRRQAGAGDPAAIPHPRRPPCPTGRAARKGVATRCRHGVAPRFRRETYPCSNPRSRCTRVHAPGRTTGPRLDCVAISARDIRPSPRSRASRMTGPAR